MLPIVYGTQVLLAYMPPFSHLLAYHEYFLHSVQYINFSLASPGQSANAN